jgi:hypothetical protein
MQATGADVVHLGSCNQWQGHGSPYSELLYMWPNDEKDGATCPIMTGEMARNKKLFFETWSLPRYRIRVTRVNKINTS